LIGDTKGNILSPEQYKMYKKGYDRDGLVQDSDYIISDRAYQLLGFLEAIGTRSIYSGPIVKDKKK